ncbi:hypothetical protein FRB91_000917 [Serendipita sp. 411]|nr:hypothetical protein FRB91_000917 [Serendipita sp. 411]
MAISSKRVSVLVGSVIVALGSGTNYAYSAYAPQLGDALHISHTQLNVIGLAGNTDWFSGCIFHVAFGREIGGFEGTKDVSLVNKP